MKKVFKSSMFKYAILAFLEGFLASLALHLTTTSIVNVSVLESILIGAIASGIGALSNFFSKKLRKEENND